MSAAQVVTSAPVPSSPGARPPSSGSAAGGGDSSFRDALESASRSSDATESGSSRVSPDRARGHKGTRDDAGKDGGSEASRGEASASATEPAVVAELATIFATLGAAPDAQVDGVDSLVAGGAPAASPETGASETAPRLPGQVGEDGEALDAAKALALLKPGAANPADLPAEAIDIKATVTGQETHLALDQVSAEARGALSAAQVSAADGEDGAAQIEGALSRLADDAAKPARRRDGGLETKAEAGAGPRAVTTAAAWGGRAGAAAFSDQGIAGHDGRQQDGRGASGAGAQQQGTGGAFMAALAAANLNAGSVDGARGGGAVSEPVSEQIAAHVRAEVKADGLDETSSEGVVKVLNLELKPANMGSVTVRLALKDNMITVHIEAQRGETLAVIEREREALTKALASAGYSVDGITAAPQGEVSRSLGGAFAGLGNSGSSASQGSFTGQAGQGLANSSGGQGGSAQAGGGHSSHRHPSDDKDTGGAGVRRGQDGLYV